MFLNKVFSVAVANEKKTVYEKVFVNKIAVCKSFLKNCRSIIYFFVKKTE